MDPVKPSGAQPAPRATVASTQAALRQILNPAGRLPNGLGKIVVATADDIQAAWEPLIGRLDLCSESKGSKGDAQGFCDPRTQTVFLVADHIPAGHEVAVAIYELFPHPLQVAGKASIGVPPLKWTYGDSVAATRALVSPDERERIFYSRARGPDPSVNTRAGFGGSPHALHGATTPPPALTPNQPASN